MIRKLVLGILAILFFSGTQVQAAEITSTYKLGILDLPDEMLVEILRHLTSLKDVKNCLYVSSKINSIFDNKKAYRNISCVGLRRKYRLNMTEYDLNEITSIHDLSTLKKYATIIPYEGVTDTDLSKLSGGHAIDLNDTVVTNKGLKYLKGVRTIYLCHCPNVTDEGLEHLAGVHTIDLRGTAITDKGLEYLAGVHTIDLRGTAITDKGLEYLAGVHTIDLRGTAVTDKGLEHLKGVNIIYLNHTKITDEGLKHLRGVRSIYLTIPNVTNAGVKFLKENDTEVFITWIW